MYRSNTNAPVLAPRARPASTILHALTHMAGLQLVLALAGIARNKALATRLGADGFGEFAQLAAAAGTLTVLVSFGLSVGVSRNVAAASSLEERRRQLANANGIVGGLGLAALFALAAALWLDGGLLARLGLTTSPAVVASLLLLALGAPLDALGNNYLAVLQGSLDIKGMTSRRGLAIVAGSAACVPLVWLLGLPGAALQSLLTTLLIAVLLGWRCAQLGYRPLSFGWHKPTAAALGALGAASLANSVAHNLGDVSVRAALIAGRGAAENGVYQAAQLLMYQVKAVIHGSVFTYSIAALSARADPAATSSEVNRILHTVVPLAAAGLGLLAVLGRPLLEALFSPAFLGAVAYLPLLLTTVLLQVFAWVIGALLLASRRTGYWLALDLVEVGAYWLTAMLLLPALGAGALAVGGLAAMALYLALNLVLYLRLLRLELRPASLGQLLIAVPVVAGLAWLGRGGFEGGLAFLAAVLLWLAYAGYAVHQAVGWRDLARRVLRGRAPGAGVEP